MRTGVLLAALACAEVVRAESLPKRKPAPPDMPVEALRILVKAELLERRNILSETMGLYHEAMERAPDQPSIHYNLGRIWMVRGSYGDAVDAFKKYVALAPKAADRAAVDKLIHDLEHRLPAITIEAREFAETDPGDVVLLDGVVMGPAPLTLHPTAGTHVFERIGPTRYAREWMTIEEAHNDRTLAPSREVGTTKGNVVIDGLQLFEHNQAWTENGVAFATGKRIQLPIGHYKTLGKIEDGDKPLCKAVEFDVRSTTELLHVHVITDDRARQDYNATCIPVTKVILNTPLRGVTP